MTDWLFHRAITLRQKVLVVSFYLDFSIRIFGEESECSCFDGFPGFSNGVAAVVLSHQLSDPGDSVSLR